MYTTILALCDMLLDFSKVERITCHQDGIARESDTDHTVMLAILASSLASKFYPDMDIGLVAQYALVHDLVEVYAGDTPTLRIISEDFTLAKLAREAHALERIRLAFGETFPWIHETILGYTDCVTREARFIKALDKVLPKITVVLNGAKYLNDNSIITKSEAKKVYDAQRIQMYKYAHDMPEIIDIWEYFVAMEIVLIEK